MQDLYLFNPDNEISIANGTNGYTPKANISIMASDLAYLSAYLSNKGDYVLVSGIPDVAFIRSREGIFGLDCKPVVWEKAQIITFNELKPWGWSPRVHNLLKDLKKSCNEQFCRGVMAEWSDGRRELYSRRMAAICLAKVLRTVPGIDATIIPRECGSLEAIRCLSEQENIVAKAPWSSSGKGVLFIPKGKMTYKEEEVLSGILHKQGYVMVERRLNRVLDFALEFEMDYSFHLNFLGYSVFHTSKRGEYEGNIVAAESRLKEIIAGYIGVEMLDMVREQLTLILATEFRGKYTGCFGVDMMIYEDVEGHFRVHPCVEINLRYNMGIVAGRLQRYLSEGSEGIFMIRFSAKPGELLRSIRQNEQDHPLVMTGSKIESGYINLTPVSLDSRFVAEFIVNKE